MIDGHDERFMVEPDIFGVTALPQSPERWEEALAYICDELCKYREGRTQEELDAICENCKAGRWAADPPTLTPKEVRELRNLKGLLNAVDSYVNGGKVAPPERSVYRLEMKLPEHMTQETIQKALNATHSSEPPRDTFVNLDLNTRSGSATKKVYTLGKMLESNCPENDCRVYLNIFRMAKSLDATIDGIDSSGYPAQVLRRDLRQQLEELRRMYLENYAVQQFKERMQK